MVDNQEIRKHLSTLIRWLWLIVLCTALGGVLAYVVSSRATPVYSATATLLVSQASGSGVYDYTSLITSERLARTYSAMLTGRPVMEAVIQQLGLDASPDALVRRISVELVRDTQLIRLSVEDTDPARAAQIANAVADVFALQNQSMQQVRYAESLANIQQQMDELALQIQDIEADIGKLGTPATTEEQAELARLQTILAGYRNTYAQLLQNYEQMRLTAARSEDNVLLFEPAQAPQFAVRPRVMQTTVAAVITGALLAVGVALLIEFLDDTIRTPDDVREALGLETLGIIGLLKNGNKELIVPDEPRSPITEAYRGLRTNIRFTSVDKPLRTLLVTSPNVTGGKSITVANLAASMAEADLKVAAVDADLRRPRLHRLFNLNWAGGLTQALLTGRVDGSVQPAMYMSRLGIVPSGELPPNPSELLGSKRMHNLLEELKARNDIVIIDSPPVIPVTDATVLARQVDGVLLVIDARTTCKAAARRAVETLRRVGANVIGVVLNAVPLRRGGYYYSGEYSEKSRVKKRRERGLVAAVNRLIDGKLHQRRSSSHTATQTRKRKSG